MGRCGSHSPSALTRRLQVMFVRVRSGLLDHSLPSAVKAAKYSGWEAEQAVARLDPISANISAIVTGGQPDVQHHRASCLQERL